MLTVGDMGIEKIHSLGRKIKLQKSQNCRLITENM